MKVKKTLMDMIIKWHYAQTRHNAFLYARDEIRKALAACMP